MGICFVRVVSDFNMDRIKNIYWGIHCFWKERFHQIILFYKDYHEMLWDDGVFTEGSSSSSSVSSKR